MAIVIKQSPKISIVHQIKINNNNANIKNEQWHNQWNKTEAQKYIVWWQCGIINHETELIKYADQIKMIIRFSSFFFNTKIKAEFIVKSKIDLVKSRVYDKSKVKISIIIPSDK